MFTVFEKASITNEKSLALSQMEDLCKLDCSKIVLFP